MKLINEKIEIEGRLFNYSATINHIGQVSVDQISELAYADDNLTLYAWDHKDLSQWSFNHLFEYGLILINAQDKLLKKNWKGLHK